MSPSSRVLLVNDKDGIRTAIVDLLGSRAVKSSLAMNGAEALSQVRGARPNAIVLDLMMPIMDTLGLHRACWREDLCAGNACPIISAYHNLADTAPRLEFDAYLARPHNALLDLEELTENDLERLCSRLRIAGA